MLKQPLVQAFPLRLRMQIGQALEPKWEGRGTSMHSQALTHSPVYKSRHSLAHTYGRVCTHTHLAHSQGQTILANGKIKAEHHLQPWSSRDNITFSATWNTNLTMYLFIFMLPFFFFFWDCLLFKILRQIVAWPWKPLRWLTLRGWLFICWHLMYDIFVRATVECNHGPFHCRVPLRLPASSRGRPSFRKYWLLDSERLRVY